MNDFNELALWRQATALSEIEKYGSKMNTWELAVEPIDIDQPSHG
jgi:hypothetical protein